MKTITAAIQTSNTPALLTAYRQFRGNTALLAGDLFAFLSNSTAEREEFLALHCRTSHQVQDNVIVTITYTAQ